MIKRIFILVMLCQVIVAGTVSAETLKKINSGQFVGEEQELVEPLSTRGRVIINAAGSLSGELRIKTGSEECRVQFQKYLKADSRKEANEYAELITVECMTQKDGVTIALRAPAQAPWTETNNSGRLNVTVIVPPKAIVEINTAYFDILADGPFSGLYVNGSLSRVYASKIYGVVDINVSNCPVTIIDVRGKLVLKNSYGKIQLKDIETDGEVAVIYGENSDVNINSFAGTLDLSTSYGEVTAQHMVLFGSRNRVKNKSAPITLDLDSLTSGKLRVNNQYGPITLNIDGPVDAGFVCKIGEESSVNANGFTLEPTLVYDDRLEFDVGKASAEVRLTARGDGNIVINGPNEE